MSRVPAKVCVYLCFRHATFLSRIHKHQTIIRGQRRVVRIDGIERERFRRGQTHHLGSGLAEQPAKNLVLPLRDAKIRSTLKPELVPRRGFLRNIPSRVARRTHHHSQQFANHGMAIEIFRRRKIRHEKYFWHDSNLAPTICGETPASYQSIFAAALLFVSVRRF